MSGPDTDVATRQRQIGAQLEAMARVVQAERAAITLGVREVRKGAAQRLDVAGQLLLGQLLEAVEAGKPAVVVRRAAAALAQHITHRGPR